jgi:hypothetical protein
MPEPKRDTHLRLVTPAATPHEAAAIVGALGSFMRATAPPPSDTPAAPDDWHAAAILEGVSRDPWAAPPDAWLGSSQ